MAVFVSTDDNNILSSENPSQVPTSSDLPVVSASGGSTGGALSAPSFALPPYTNRGAEITIPPENRSLLDWVAFTLMVNDPHEVMDTLALSSPLFTAFNYGFSGYRKSLRFGNISVYYEGREGMGCHVEMSGQGCREYEAQFEDNPWPVLFQTALAASAKFTRLDLAIDNVDGALSLERIGDALKYHDRQVRTRFGEWRRIQKGSFLKGEEVTGETIYLGSAKSHLMCRIYNKAQESGIDGNWIRFEIQLRDKRSHEAAKLFNAGVNVGSLATGIINNYFAIINDDDANKTRCTLQSWWSEWLDSTEKIKLTTAKDIKLVSDSMEFIKRQYAPSLAMINKHLGKTTFNDYFQEVLDDGRQRLGAKHERILAKSAAKVLKGQTA